MKNTKFFLCVCVCVCMYCRHCILYPLQLRPPFSNYVRTLTPKVGLEYNQMKIDLRKMFMENITYFWSIKLFLENKGHRNPRVCVRILKLYVRMLPACIHIYGHACAC